MEKHTGDRHGHRRHISYTDIDGDRGEYPESRRDRPRTHRIRHKPLEKYSRTRRHEWFDEADDDRDY